MAYALLQITELHKIDLVRAAVVACTLPSLPLQPRSASLPNASYSIAKAAGNSTPCEFPCLVVFFEALDEQKFTQIGYFFLTLRHTVVLSRLTSPRKDVRGEYVSESHEYLPRLTRGKTTDHPQSKQTVCDMTIVNSTHLDSLEALEL